MNMGESTIVDENILISGPSFHVDLAPLDALHPIHYSRRLLIFRCDSSAQRETQLAAFKKGLQALISRCPILGGKVVPLPDHGDSEYEKAWRTIVPDEGIELFVRDLRKSLPSFGELEKSQFSSSYLPYDLLVPIPGDINNAVPFAACKMQFNAIKGGTIITWSMSHSVGDGSGNNELIRILSDEIRKDESNVGKATASSSLHDVVGIDRTLLRNITSDNPFNLEDHPAFIPNTASSEVPKTTHPFQTSEVEIPVILHISPAKLALLKADATTPGAPHISTHDALSALIWRSTLLIRSRRSAAAQEMIPSTTGSLFLPSDARRHLGLPQSYIGNAVYQLTADLDLKDLLSPSGLQQAAGSLRRAITAVTPPLVESYMAELKKRWLDWKFMESYATTGVAMGTDWTSGVLYSHDWGNAFGPLVRYRYPDGAFNCILPKLPDGTAEVQMGVLPREVEFLKSMECFGKYIDS